MEMNCKKKMNEITFQSQQFSIESSSLSQNDLLIEVGVEGEE
jgi:hypothetical protein